MDYEQDPFAAPTSAVPEEAYAEQTYAYQPTLGSMNDMYSPEVAEKHSNIKAEARSQLEAFYAERATKKSAAHTLNTEREVAFKSDYEATMASPNTWERVTKFVDLAPKASASGKDLGRFRQVLLQLKNA
eukprot:TRINITY_DN666_c0_g1_i3.p1 TRINITY_DN666_c0_g1~~TRINITY_DN666_c0_g1_i3.p1  ORF type:complete len:147 (+),score=89.76 TRINITY_DN666_c0_g1_i3:53-442(+)